MEAVDLQTEGFQPGLKDLRKVGKGVSVARHPK